MSSTFYKLEIYIPIAYVEALRLAMNTAGACHVGLYDHCISVTSVTGFWRPLPGAHPFQGEVGEVNHAPEAKVETLCPAACLEATVAAIRQVHPYEEPVIYILPLHTVPSPPHPLQ